MKMRSLIIALFTYVLVLPAAVFSQTVYIKGSVVDHITGKGISNVTINVGINKYLVNNEGEFSFFENESQLKQKGFLYSSIGYIEEHVEYSNKTFYLVKLRPTINNLDEVSITAKAETILERAIRKIQKNYPTKDFILEGILRLTRTLKDSTGTNEFYNNDAFIKLFQSNYAENTDAKVTLIQNKYKQLISSANPSGSIKWLNGYLTPTINFIYQRADFITKKKLKNYTYTLTGKEKIDNYTVYAISFKSIKNRGNKFEGILYIDSISSAFVAAHYTIANPYGIDNSSFVRDRIKNEIDIKFVKNEKWYLSKVRTKSSYLNPLWNTENTFITTSLDTVDVTKFAYPDIIQNLEETLAINKPGKEKTWQMYKNLFNEAENKGLMNIVIKPLIKGDTSEQKTKAKFKGSSILKYVRSNLRYSLGVSSLPLNFDFYQSLLNKNFSKISPYGIIVNIQLRVIGNLFIDLGTFLNFNINGMHNEASSFGFMYDFKFNKKGHPITLSPFIGYQSLDISKNEINYYYQKSLKYGLNLSYELTKKISFYGAVNYNRMLRETNQGLLIKNNNVYPSAGILLKFN